MAPTTTVGKTRDGRWQIMTKDPERPQVFVSSVDLHGSGLEELDNLLFGGSKRFETIMHDENGWKETPEGTNAYQYDTQAECEADRPRVLALLFGA